MTSRRLVIDSLTADILPDLVEIGLDALNAQLFTMDVAGNML